MFRGGFGSNITLLGLYITFSSLLISFNSNSFSILYSCLIPWFIVNCTFGEISLLYPAKDFPSEPKKVTGLQ